VLAWRSLVFVGTALLFICGVGEARGASDCLPMIEQKGGAVRSPKFSWHVTWRVSSLHT
jgi:hypothetical protein